MTLLKERKRVTPDGSCGVARGRCASAGVASGTAKVVTSLEDAERVEPGDVVVVPFASLAWSAVFDRASAMIAERGGELSSLATAARERGVPLAVGVTDATTLIAEGSNVIVNATAGKVRWHSGDHLTPYLCGMRQSVS